MHAQDDGGELELRDYLVVLRRRWLLIAATTVAVVAAAVGASLAQTKIYRSTAEVLLQPRASEEIFSPDAQSRVGQDRTIVQTEIEVMRSRSVHQAVTEALGEEPDVDIAARGETRVVRISAEDPVPARAAEVANTYARVYIETRRQATIDDLLAAAEQVQAKINDIDQQLAELDRPIRALDDLIAEAATPEERREVQAQQDVLRQDVVAQRQALQTQRAAFYQQLSQLELSGNLTQTGGAQLVSEAEVPEAPSSPTPRRNAILAFIVGLLLGTGLAFLREYLDDSLRTKEDLEKAAGLTVLGLIPEVAEQKDARTQVVSIEQPTSQAAEAYRTLRTSIQFMGLDRPIQLIQATSAHAAEGKTTTVANLAVALSRAGQRVVLVDCDLRRPRLAQYMGCKGDVGFTSVLLGHVSISDALQTVPGEQRLAVLASGPVPPNPSELLSSPRTRELFDRLKTAADVVLVDSPPILPVTDGLIIAGMADATILVASATKKTSQRAVHRAVELLHQIGAPLSGAVLNGVKPGSGYDYGYGYAGDGYGYAPETPPKGRRREQAPQETRAPSPLG